MMNRPAIQFNDLSKTFGKGEFAVHAVQNLHLDVAPRQVFGFLGPNGAGKTTTIRLLLDLIRPTSGEAYLFGYPIGDPQGLSRVGALVEGADFYPFMSGRENLAVLARTANVFSASRIEEVLRDVDLKDRADQKVGDYSTGMKQRLGIAGVLLSDPDLVIFDEPTNGLDPAGIQEMRSFIRSLARDQGKTVFLSSHLLNEVEQVCDRVAIINKGLLIQHGPVDDLLNAGGHSLHIQVDRVESALQALHGQWSCHASPTSNHRHQWIEVLAGVEDSPNIVTTLVRNEVRIFQIIDKRRSLEEFFISVTSVEETGQGAH